MTDSGVLDASTAATAADPADPADVVEQYADDIVHRARTPMAPFDFEPDWVDQPRRHKVYRGAPRFVLPAGPAELPRSLAETLVPGRPGDRPPALDRSLTLDLLGGLMRDSYGLLTRRLQVTGNFDVTGRTSSRHTLWGRGTASGGGLYPCEIYWVSGPGGPTVPGVYHYSPPHHAMQRLVTGDVTDRVRAALPARRDAHETDQFLVATVRFWKNAFKYSSFCYHVVTMDTGCLAATWQLWARAAGARLEPSFWFDEPALDDLLGLDPEDESVFAVVPVPWGPGDASGPTDPAPAGALAPVSVLRTAEERSAKVERFARIGEVHRATLVDGAVAPPAGRIGHAAVTVPAGDGPAVPLPDATAAWPDAGVPDVLARRRSSFGMFSAARPLTTAELAAVLAAGGHGRHLASDVRGPDGPPLTRLAVFVSHVDGVPSGAYHYDADAHELRPVPGDPIHPFLQYAYFLNNYNVEQAAAVAVVLGRPQAAVRGVAPRAYRVLNAEVGAVAETVYLAAAGLGLTCGAALGFDNVAFQERLGLAGDDEWPLLMLMLGRDRAMPAELVHRLH